MKPSVSCHPNGSRRAANPATSAAVSAAQLAYPASGSGPGCLLDREDERVMLLPTRLELDLEPRIAVPDQRGDLLRRVVGDLAAPIDRHQLVLARLQAVDRGL